MLKYLGGGGGGQNNLSASNISVKQLMIDWHCSSGGFYWGEILKYSKWGGGNSGSILH